jgi:SAM-dependent methyltransferase
MPKDFADHFSSIAGAYAASRPRYPDALFEWLASLVPRRDLAWDCAAGNGQATVPLARFFGRVIATDASALQLDAAPRHERIEYRVAPAHASGIAGGSADLVTVAQALHWFDVAAFYREAERVLAPDGVLAVWTYGRVEVGSAPLDRAIARFHDDVVGPYWPPGRCHVETGYRSLAFPFAEIESPVFAIALRWTLAAFLGYVRTWSATVRFREARGHDPVVDLEREIRADWGDREREIRWPIRVRAGRRRGSRRREFGLREAGRDYVVRWSAYGLVLNERREVALVRTSGGGLFLPGGGIEAGETPERAIVRELREECGFAVSAIRLVAEAVQLVYSPAEATHFEKPCVFMEAAEIGSRTTASEPDHALVWVPLAGAAARLSQESHAYAVAEFERRLGTLGAGETPP